MDLIADIGMLTAMCEKFSNMLHKHYSKLYRNIILYNTYIET